MSTALIVTFVVENHVDEDKNKDAMLWEAEFIKYLKSYKGENITVSFMAEVHVTTCISVHVLSDYCKVVD